MKKLILASLIGLTMLSAQADGYRGHYHNHYRGGGWDWVVPAVIGGAVVYSVTHPTVIQPQPVIVQPQVPYGYHYENILDANCNCYKTVLVPN